MSNFARSALKSLIREEFPSLTAFAKQCGISQSIVWRDCQDRTMSDARFAKYIQNLSASGQERLIRARLRDILPEPFGSKVELRSSSRLREDPPNATLLSAETQKALGRLAGEMARDTELHDWVIQFIRRVC